ncbi:MAG: hypothetical protein AB7L09_02545 [Nitrospira sp.]
MSSRDTDGFEIIVNGTSKGIYRKETADKKLKELLGCRQWIRSLFPGCVVYKSSFDSSADRVEITNVGCLCCVRKTRQQEKAK